MLSLLHDKYYRQIGELIWKLMPIDAKKYVVEYECYSTTESCRVFWINKEGKEKGYDISNAWSVSGFASGERGKSRYKQVNEQAGLFAGDGGYHVEANNIYLKGSAIASTNPNNSELSTNRFTFEDIRNESSHKATSASISGSYGKGKDYYLDKDTGKLSQKGAENATFVEGKTGPSFNSGIPMHSQGSDSSTTRATLTEGKITLNKDTTPTQTSANALGINTDLSQANSQVEKPKEVKKLLVEQKEIAQAVGHISQAANVYANNKAKETQDVEWQEGGSKRRKLDAAVATIGAILSGGSAGQVAAAAISPELNAQIHKLTEDSKTLNLLAHALLSAAEAHLSGANALAGAASGVAGEASAMFLSEVFFNKPAEQLSDEERTIIKVASQLSGAVAGNVSGGNTSSTILGAETAKRAVENNYLNNLEVENLVRELAQAEKEGKDPKAIFEKYEQISEANRQAMIEECGNNPVCYLPHIYQMGTGNEEAYENLSGLRFTSYKNGLSGGLKGKMATFVENENANSYAGLPSSVHYAGMAMDAATAVGLGGLGMKDIKGYLTKQPVVTPPKGYENAKLRVSIGAESSAAYQKMKLDLATEQNADKVIASLKTTGQLPPEYVTKDIAKNKYAWEQSKPFRQGQIGGDIFLNRQKLLPEADGRIWREADLGINNNIGRNKQAGTRLLYSNDGLLFITTDHYESFKEIGKWK